MQFTTTTISITLAALPLISANGCYSGGASFADYGTADQLLAARTEACNHLVSLFLHQHAILSCQIRKATTGVLIKLLLFLSEC